MSLLRASLRMTLRSRGVVFVLPGMAALLPILSLEDITIAIAASYKARGILRRLAVAPVSPARLIGTQILSYLALRLVAAALALAIGTVMGARVVIGQSLLWLIPIQAIGVLTALAIAFTIAGLTPTPATANIVGGAVVLPLFALTGAILPVAAMPAPLPNIVPYALPYTALIDAVRGIALTGSSITAYGPQLAVGTAWLVAMFMVEARAYRFTDDR